MITGEVEAVDRKQKIRDRYKGVDISELEVIPAKIIEDLETSSVIRRVAAYIRVSTDNDEQTSSYELQKNYYTDYIQAQPGWVFVGIYADEGISGTSLEHRKGMQQLIEDCKAGKIDLVLTKSIARFARNIVDCLSVIELLKNLNPPVGVKFEADNIYTLDSNGRMILTILASVAEEESHSKSIIMNWSIDRRFSRGLFLTPALLGYDKDEEGNLVINPEEAQTVKVIYYLYLNGYSLTEIATLLMEYSRKTKLGRVEWNPGTLAGVLANERHCGDVLARKTFTPNFLTHKSKKNNNDRTQYRQKNHHEAIVSREVFNAANHLRASRNYSKKNRPLPVLSVVEDGILRGYVPFDKDWTGFSAEEYREASESVMKEPDVTVTADVKKRLDLTGYEIVSECRYKMLGYRITFEGETLYVFDLLVPEIFHEGQRKKNAVDSQDNAASTKPVNSRKGFYLDDIVGTFGVPVEEHRKESEVKQMDGYVSMGILTGKIAPEAGKD